jgi:beta-glucosidase/6-phospho-beta-glucosidase/beta-galactosidase
MESQTSIRRPLPHYGAFESTRIHGYRTDILETTRHIERWQDDLDMLRDAELSDLRYSAPWHRIERQPGEFDFSWLDGPMQYMRDNGMRPVVDLLHHTSFPDWLKEGFANPDFPRLYTRFVSRFMRRYDWVDTYTIFNEPLATTLMCSCIGAWYPFRKSDNAFVRMALNVAGAICSVEETIRNFQPDYTSVYIDTCEFHHPLDRGSTRWVEFVNHRRFMMADLVLGRVSEQHPLWNFLVSHGMTDRGARWLRDHPIRIDLLGLDYYPHSEMDWRDGPRTHGELIWPVNSPRGFADVAMDYVSRYNLPVMLGETNVRGTVSDRITWLRFMEEQTARLSEKADVRGFCWYPSVDSTDWCHVCAHSTASVDPQGIWYLDKDRYVRYPSELSDWYSRLARGEACWHNLPPYRFLQPLHRDLAGYRKLMRHWSGWIELPEAEEAA